MKIISEGKAMAIADICAPQHKIGWLALKENTNVEQQ
jgi:hypothetical protein